MEVLQLHQMQQRGPHQWAPPAGKPLGCRTNADVVQIRVAKFRDQLLSELLCAAEAGKETQIIQLDRQWLTPHLIAPAPAFNRGTSPRQRIRHGRLGEFVLRLYIDDERSRFSDQKKIGNVPSDNTFHSRLE